MYCCDTVYPYIKGCNVCVHVVSSTLYHTSHSTRSTSLLAVLLPCHLLGGGGGVSSVKRGFPRCLELSKNFMCLRSITIPHDIYRWYYWYLPISRGEYNANASPGWYRNVHADRQIFHDPVLKIHCSI